MEQDEVLSRFMVERPGFLNVSRKKYLLTICKDSLVIGPVTHDVYNQNDSMIIRFADIREVIPIKPNEQEYIIQVVTNKNNDFYV